MDETNFVGSARVLIWGLGLMGGSLGLSLKGRCASVIGIDPNPDAVAMALEMNAVDEVSTSLQSIKNVDLIILAAPVRGILEQIGTLLSDYSGSAIVLDLGSTKREIVTAMESLPEKFDPVGGHPMCGREKSSILNADPEIYQNATFALVKTEKTSEKAMRICEQLVCAVGAEPLWMDAETHDRWTAATSHLPFLIANILAASVPVEAEPLVGPGFHSTTRLAVESTDMMLDILFTNRENILSALRNYRFRLSEIETALDSKHENELKNLLLEGAKQRNALIGILH